jgi:hypothetical protein
VSLEQAFERDLERWLDGIYRRQEQVARYEGQHAVERIVDGQNRLLITLVIGLGISMLLMPIHGGIVVIAGLVLVYVGALVSSVLTAARIRVVERSTDRTRAIAGRRAEALSACPPLDSDDRAQIVRLINLTAISGQAGGRQALAAELAQARLLPGLANWTALEDARVLIEPPPREHLDEYEALHGAGAGSAQWRDGARPRGDA